MQRLLNWLDVDGSELLKGLAWCGVIVAMTTYSLGDPLLGLLFPLVLILGLVYRAATRDLQNSSAGLRVRSWFREADPRAWIAVGLGAGLFFGAVLGIAVWEKTGSPAWFALALTTTAGWGLGLGLHAARKPAHQRSRTPEALTSASGPCP